MIISMKGAEKGDAAAILHWPFRNVAFHDSTNLPQKAEGGASPFCEQALANYQKRTGDVI